jgi:hypothetical protein
MTDYLVSVQERPDMFTAHVAAPSSSEQPTAHVAISEIPAPHANVTMREIEQ